MNNESECHWDTQTRENNGENTSAQHECFFPLFSSVWISRWNTSSSCSYGFSNELRRNRMFWFIDLNRTSNQADRNWLHVAYVVKIFEEDHQWFSSIVVLCLMLFHRVTQGASRDQMGLCLRLNCSWIINDLRRFKNLRLYKRPALILKPQYREYTVGSLSSAMWWSMFIQIYGVYWLRPAS